MSEEMKLSTIIPLMHNNVSESIIGLALIILFGGRLGSFSELITLRQSIVVSHLSPDYSNIYKCYHGRL